MNWSNTETAPPLCRHVLDEAIEREETGKGAGFAETWEMSKAAGIADSTEGFGAMIRSAYAKLYEPGATCIHTANGEE